MTTASIEFPIRQHFLGWQCRIRQIAMRDMGGRPTPGMRPRVRLLDGSEAMPAMTMLIVPEESAESTAFLQFQAKRTADPSEVREKALRYLRSTHFQIQTGFGDEITALFSDGSPTAAALAEAGACLLEFEQFGQNYKLACAVRKIPDEDPAHAATYWHNRVFNAALPARVTVLGFTPDWPGSTADPGV